MSKLSFVLMTAEVSKAKSRAGCGSLSKFLLAWVIVSHKTSAAVLALVTRPVQSLLAVLYAQQLKGGGLSVPDKPSSCPHLLHLAWENRKWLFGKRAPACRRPDPALSQLYKATPCSPGMRGGRHDFLLALLPRSLLSSGCKCVPSGDVAAFCLRGSQVHQGCLNSGAMLVSWEFTSSFSCWFVESLKFMKIIFLLKWPCLPGTARDERRGMILQKSYC